MHLACGSLFEFMQRRQVLAALGSSTALAMAGCLAAGPSSPDDGPTDTTTTTNGSTTPGDAGKFNPGADDPFQILEVGSREHVDFPENQGPHVTRVWNAADEQRTLTLTLDSENGPGLDRTLEFPADGWVKLVANEPADYTLVISEDGTRAGELVISRSWFDCNDSWTNVVVSQGGELSSSTLSTELACPGPAIADRAITVGSASCSMEDEAEVRYVDEVIEVEGRVRTPNPCYGLEIASVELRNAKDFGENDGDVLVLTIRATKQQGDVCTSCVGSVPYTATIDVENEYPSNVRVNHISMGEERTVTTVHT